MRRRAIKREERKRKAALSASSWFLSLSLRTVCVRACPFKLNKHFSPPHCILPTLCFPVQTCSLPLHLSLKQWGAAGCLLLHTNVNFASWNWPVSSCVSSGSCFIERKTIYLRACDAASFNGIAFGMLQEGRCLGYQLRARTRASKSRRYIEAILWRLSPPRPKQIQRSAGAYVCHIKTTHGTLWKSTVYDLSW